MKRIRNLSRPTDGLARYLACGGDPADWPKFYDDDRDAYRELRNALVELQHHLCGYCEISLIENDVQVEHVIPQSDPEQGAAQALNYANLIAVCLGGTQSAFTPNALGDTERFRRPVNRNRSCGEAKGDINDRHFIDPRSLPALQPLLLVLPDGKMVADADACAEGDITVERVQKTIAILGLNSERLQEARRNRWNDLKQSWDSFRDNADVDVDVLEAVAREELLPDDGGLRKFFTTSRSYFGHPGENILAQPPQSWI